MNVAVINLKEIIKYFIKILVIIFLLYIWTKHFIPLKNDVIQFISPNAKKTFLYECLNITVPELNIEEKGKTKVSAINLIKFEIAMLNMDVKKQPDDIQTEEEEKTEHTDISNTQSPQVEISKTAETEYVTDRNFVGSYTDIYNTTKIDNQSKYDFTQEMLTPDEEIDNKKNVLIYHTHTCESYTPCEIYNYTMTGNYRTTDSNYNVVRVGNELQTYLEQKGFKVVHDSTYHDYPSYSGSYARSLETAKKMLEGQDADIVIDLHRDAMGNGDTYGPTIMVNGERVAQLMFVIGTDGGGLEHTDWEKNLKIAVKIQEKANEMYPGLFRPIIVRNSRYNQHLAKGASIIEVGATANTLSECLLSMQCLANVLEEVCK